MNSDELREIRERAYGMAVANLNPEDVADYMAIASACARMESRRGALPKQCRCIDSGDPTGTGRTPCPEITRSCTTADREGGR